MNFLPDFSHIYVESQSIDSNIAEQSFKRFPKAKIIEIEDYKKINPIDFRIECILDKNESVLVPRLTKKPDFVKNIRLSSNQIQLIILE